MASQSRLTDRTTSTSIHQTWLTDAIASPPADLTCSHVARAKVTGVEATVTHEFNDRWMGKASIDYRLPKNEDNGRAFYRDRSGDCRAGF